MSCLRFTHKVVNSPIEDLGVSGALDNGGGVTGVSVNGVGVSARILYIIGYTARRDMGMEILREFDSTPATGTLGVRIKGTLLNGTSGTTG